jgi:hypothetical protein
MRSILLVALLAGMAMAARVVDREGNYYLCDKGQYAYFVYDKDTVDWGGDYAVRVFEVTKDKHKTGWLIWDCGFAETYDDALKNGQALKERAMRSVEQQNREVLEAGLQDHLSLEVMLRQVEATRGPAVADSIRRAMAEEDSLRRTRDSVVTESIVGAALKTDAIPVPPRGGEDVCIGVSEYSWYSHDGSTSVYTSVSYEYDYSQHAPDGKIILSVYTRRQPPDQSAQETRAYLTVAKQRWRRTLKELRD